MDEKRFIEIIEANNEKLVNLMDEKIEANNGKLANLMDEKIEANNEKLVNLIDKKIEANNEKLANLMDKKIIANNGRIADFMDMNNEALLLKLDKRFVKLEREIKEVRKELKGEIKEVREELKGEIGEVREELKEVKTEVNNNKTTEVNNNKTYFEETYDQKNNILFQKFELNERFHMIEREELNKYKKENDERLNSYDARITNLEKAVNA